MDGRERIREASLVTGDIRDEASSGCTRGGGVLYMRHSQDVLGVGSGIAYCGLLHTRVHFHC